MFNIFWRELKLSLILILNSCKMTKLIQVFMLIDNIYIYNFYENVASF